MATLGPFLKRRRDPPGPLADDPTASTESDAGEGRARHTGPPVQMDVFGRHTVSERAMRAHLDQLTGEPPSLELLIATGEVVVDAAGEAEDSGEDADADVLEGAVERHNQERDAPEAAPLELADPGRFPESAPADEAVGHQRQERDEPEVAPVTSFEQFAEPRPKPTLTNRRVPYVKCLERINVAMAVALIKSNKYRGASYRGHSINSALGSFVRRAALDETGMYGNIEVLYWTAENPLKTQGRRYSGYAGGRVDNPREKRIPEPLRFISAFSMPREIKEALRVGVDYHDVDLRHAHLAAFAKRHGITQGPIKDLLERSAEFKQELQSSDFAKRNGKSAAAKLPIVLLNGGTPPLAGAPAWAADLQAQLREYHAKDAKAFNEKQPACKDAYTYGYFLNEEVERSWIDALGGLAHTTGSKVVGYEHDGLLLLGGDVETLVETAAAQGIAVAIKPHPRTCEEWTRAWDVHEGDLPAPSRELVDEFLDEPLTRALASTTDPIDHDAWTRVLLDCFSETAFPEFVKNREDAENLVIEYWDEKRLKWISAGGARFMKDRFASALRQYIRRHAPEEDIGALAGNAMFQNPIIEALKVKLPAATDQGVGPLHGDATRGLLRFDDGMVVDFRTGAAFPCEPKHRVGYSTKCLWRSFEGDERKAIEAIVARFEVQVSRGQQSIKGSALEQMLSELRRARPTSLYAILWGVFEDDDVAVWVLRQCCRGVAGFEILEEFLMFYDERGQNGKGTILTLLRLALGEYYTTCTYKALADSPSGNNDRLAKCQGKRVISCNEAFKKQDVSLEFDASVIKTLIGLDDPIETMQKYKAPVEWRGQALLIISSNILPCFPAGDGGLASRISLLRFPFTFIAKPAEEDGDESVGEHPEDPGARWQDPAIKLRGMEALVPEFFCWALHFNEMLLAQTLTGRVMTPRPPKIEAETAELFRVGALAGAGEQDSDLLRLLRDFEQLHLTEVPRDTNTRLGATPATCGQIESRFFEYVHEKGVRGVSREVVVALLRRVFVMTVPPAGKKLFTVNKTSVRSFYRRVDHGATVPAVFQSALLLKTTVVEALQANAASESAASG